MLKRLFSLSVVICFLTGCKSPEARMPESVQSGSFLKESAERNIKLNAIEQEAIEKIIANNPSVKYLNSESGFWYYYNNKVEIDTLQPEFGDIVDLLDNLK